MNKINTFLANGEQLLRNGDFARAYVDYHAIMDISFNGKSPIKAINSLLNLANIARSTGQQERSIEYFKKALFVAKESASATLAVKPLLGLAQAVLEAGRDGDARGYYRKALLIAQKSGDPQLLTDVEVFELY